MNRRQHHRSIPRKGELSTEVMGSQNTAPAPHRAGCVGATTTTRNDGHRAPCTTTSLRTSHATSQEDMRQARLHHPHRRDTLHNTCTRSRQSTRHINATRVRNSAHQRTQGSSPAGSYRGHQLCTLRRTNPPRPTMASGPQRQQIKVHRTKPRPVQPQRRRQGIPPVRLDTLGGTLQSHTRRQTAGEVAKGREGFKISGWPYLRYRSQASISVCKSSIAISSISVLFVQA